MDAITIPAYFAITTGSPATATGMGWATVITCREPERAAGQDGPAWAQKL